MTTILSDDFTTLTNWSPPGTLVAGRTGNGMQLSGTSASSYTIPAGALRTDSETASFSWQINSLSGNRPICSFASGGVAGAQVTLRAISSGALEALAGGTTGTPLGATAAGVVAINTWYTIEIATHIDNVPNGAVRIKVNGTTRLDVTGVDTLISGVTPILDTFTVRSSSGSISIFDDLLLTTDSPAGATVKVHDGSSFVSAPAKVFNGTAYVDAVAIKTWNGSAFV